MELSGSEQGIWGAVLRVGVRSPHNTLFEFCMLNRFNTQNIFFVVVEYELNETSI